MPGMNTPQRVAVTGSAGRVGRATVRELVARGHRVVGFDRAPTPGLPADQSVVGTLADRELIGKVVAGVDCLIHLAAAPDDLRFPRGTPPDDGDNFLSDLVPSNVVGLYHVLEAARTAGVRRLILASTGQTVDGHLSDGNVPVTATMPTRPRYLYACTKVFLEAMGRVYAEQHGMAVAAVRIGWCPRDAGQVAEIAADPQCQDVFLSPGDVGRFFAAAVEAPAWAGFEVVFATSRPVEVWQYDPGPAERLFGYAPRDRWPAGADDFA
jgi:uronate dehydrogenase